MYTNFTIERLRGVERLVVQDLRRVNLVVGTNNAGKTTLLEGLFLLGDATNPMALARLARLRGEPRRRRFPDALWRPFFWRMDPRASPEVRGLWHGEGQERQLQVAAVLGPSHASGAGNGVGGRGVATSTERLAITGIALRYTSAVGVEQRTRALYWPSTGKLRVKSAERPDYVRTTLLSARSYPSLVRAAQQYSYLVRTKQERDVVEAVRLVDRRVQRIEILTESGDPSLFVDIGLNSLVPLSACGEGFVRLFSIAVELLTARGGVLLIDEIDNGLHHSVMNPVWNLLSELSRRYDVQIVATTHNEEMIYSAFDAFAGHLEEICLYRIDRRGENHVAVQYDEDNILGLQDFRFEVRG